MRGLVLVVLAGGFCGLLGARADDSPKGRELTPDQRKELEQKWAQSKGVADRAYAARKLAEMEKALRECLEVAQRLHPDQDAPLLAESLNNLAFVLQTRGQSAAAEPLFRDALEMRKRLFKGDHLNVANSLSGLASVLRDRSKYTDAEPLYREALEMRRRLFKGDHPSVAISLSDLAAVLHFRGHSADAELLYREALEMYKRLFKGDHPDVATNLNNLASVLHSRGKSADAEALFRDALEMRKRLFKGDHPSVAQSLNDLASVLHAHDKSADAEALFRDTLEMRKRLFKGDHPSVGSSLNNLASVLQARGQYADAEPLYREALEMHKRLFKGDHADVANSLNGLAFALEHLGKHADVEALHREALEMRKRLFKGDHPDVANSLNNLAFVLRYRGQYADAETLLREALEMRKRLFKSDHPDVANSLSGLASVLRDRGKYVGAEALFRDALEMRKRLFKGDHLTVAQSLNNLASVLHARDKNTDAEALFRDALEMRKRLFKSDHPDVANSLNGLASVLRARGKNTDAEALFRDALEMRKRLFKGDHLTVAQSLNNLASVLHARGKSADAEVFYRDALEMHKRLFRGDHPSMALSLNNLAFVLHYRGKYAAAESLFRDALRMYDRLATAHARDGAEGEALTLAASQPLARDTFLSCTRANRSEAETVYAEVWMSKAVVSRVAERRALAARAATDPKAVGLLADLRDARRRRAELILAPTPNDLKARDARDAELETLDHRIREQDQALRPLLPAIERLEVLAGATPQDLRKALPANAAFIDLLAYKHLERDTKDPGREGQTWTPSYAAFVVSREGVRRVELGPADTIDTAVRKWREAVTAVPYHEPTPDLPRAVRERVWEPICKALPAGVRVAYLSPDAALTGVPWCALPGDKPGIVLLEELMVAVVPHGPALLDAVRPSGPSRRSTAGLFAVGGVSYGGEPEPSGGWGAAAVTLARSRARGELPADPKPQPAWADLAGTKLEVEQLRKRAADRGLEMRLLSGRTATTERVMDELGRVKYAHLATHGFFADPQFQSAFRLDPELFAFDRDGRERVGAGATNPMVMSGLVFAGANRPGTPGRGVLTGEGLLDRDLSGLELAVLSACETGLGNVADGQGVFGLQRAFHLAGCRNVVASLWKVDDLATAALMGEFYRRLWAEKDALPPLEALRQAQLAVMRADPKEFKAMAARGIGKGEVKDPDVRPEDGRPAAGKVNPPAYWAAFTLSGPGR